MKIAPTIFESRLSIPGAGERARKWLWKCRLRVTGIACLNVALWVLPILERYNRVPERSVGDGMRGGFDEGGDCSAGAAGAADR